MSEEALDRVTQHLTQLQTELRSGFTEVRSDIADLRSGLTEVRSDLSEVRSDIAELRPGLSEVRSDISDLRSGLSDLDRHMHVLHEDVLDCIAATREYSGPTRTEFAELKEMIERRLDPLETAVRHHSLEIEQLKHSRA
jgi:chromosome segregation ATPase